MSIVILAAIPVFLLLIFLEIAIDIKRKTGFYQFNDAINSLHLGILSRVSRVLLGLIPFSFYVYFYQNWRVVDLPLDSVWVWVFAFIAYDLVYYWVHRLSHTINIMWGSHVVHHSSEEYNLTTALRQTSTPAIFSWMIIAPLAFLGVSPELLLTCASLNLVYQFWVHTRHIDKLPAWYEAIFVTPSHHRVHHALNKDYIDKNFAGVLILWDKMFGSFQAEKQEMPVVFGISSQLASWNPIRANFQVYVNLWQDAAVTKGLKNKIKVWLSPPSWRSVDAKEQNPRKYITTKSMVKYDVNLTSGQQGYILFQHIAILVMTVGWLLSLTSFTLTMLITTCAFAIFTLFTVSVLQEVKTWSWLLELTRVVVSGALMRLLLPTSALFTAIIGMYVLVSIIWFIKGYKPFSLTAVKASVNA